MKLRFNTFVSCNDENLFINFFSFCYFFSRFVRSAAVDIINNVMFYTKMSFTLFCKQNSRTFSPYYIYWIGINVWSANFVWLSKYEFNFYFICFFFYSWTFPDFTKREIWKHNLWLFFRLQKARRNRNITLSMQFNEILLTQTISRTRSCKAFSVIFLSLSCSCYFVFIYICECLIFGRKLIVKIYRVGQKKICTLTRVTRKSDTEVQHVPINQPILNGMDSNAKKNIQNAWQ